MTTTRRRLMALGAAGFATATLAGCGGSADANTLAPIDARDRTLGDPDAPVTLIEYASPTCGHCASFHKGAFPEVRTKYVDTGQVRFVLREALLNPADYHIWLIARCLPEESFFPFMDVVFDRQRDLLIGANEGIDAFRAELSRLARGAGLNADAYDTCITDQAEIDRLQMINESFVDTFERLATPAFVIGDTYYDEIAAEAQPTNQLTIEDFDAILEPRLARG